MCFISIMTARWQSIWKRIDVVNFELVVRECCNNKELTGPELTFQTIIGISFS